MESERMMEQQGPDFPVQEIDDNGFAFVGGILTADQAQETLKQVQEYAKSKKTRSTDKSNLLHLEGNDRFKTHLFLSEINAIVHNPKLLQSVRIALGTPHIALWSSDLNIKQPNSKSFFSEHQDATYTGLQPASQCLTVWVALSDPVGVNEGCLSFLKTSHKQGQLPHVEEVGNDENMLSRGQRVVYGKSAIDEWIPVPLRAGDATLHRFYTVHKSGHNLHPTQPRVGLALRYMAQTVRQTGPTRELVTWIDNGDKILEENDNRKKELQKHFDLEPRLPCNPTDEDIQKGVQAHGEAMDRENSNYFQQSETVKGYSK